MSVLTLGSLVTLERRGWDALCASTGGEFYGNLMTSDGVMILVNGAVLERDEVIASLDEAPAWDSYELAVEQLVPFGSGAAALVYRATARRGEEKPFHALMSSVYVDTHGDARLALYQQTALIH